MKCIFISTYYGSYPGNFVPSMIAFDKKMKSEGNSIVYIFPKETKVFGWMTDFKNQNNQIYFLDYRPYSLNNFFAFRKIFKKEKIDLIYSHFCGWDFTARFAAPFKPIIWHMHMNVNVHNKIKRIKNWVKFRVLGFAKTYHIAVSQPVTDAINSLNPHNKCVTIPNCLDLSRLSPCSTKNFDQRNNNILIFGWEPTVKGLDITLDACEKLANEGKKFNLLVSSQEKTHKYIAERYKNIPEWLQPLEPTGNVAELYNKADIMLSASRTEGFSYALGEAIYSGLVTVVSDISPNSWSREFKARFEFKSEDVDSLLIALKQALKYTPSTNDISYNKKLFEQKYSLKTWTDSIHNFLSSVYNNKI